MASFLYKGPRVYHYLMHLIYGKYFYKRYSTIANLIPIGSQVFEVCAGDCYLYLNYLKQKQIRYECCDINNAFLKHAHLKNINACYLNILENKLPFSEYIIMQASLYQFYPHHKLILDKLIYAGKVAVILAEPIINLGEGNSLLANFAKKCTNPGTGHKQHRFNESSLDKFIYEHYHVSVAFKIPGGREKVYVLACAEENAQYAANIRIAQEES